MQIYLFFTKIIFSQRFQHKKTHFLGKHYVNVVFWPEICKETYFIFLKHHYSTYIMTQSDSEPLTLNVRIRS